MDQDEEYYSILYSFQTDLRRTTVNDKFVTSRQNFCCTKNFF